ncbi:nephrin-like [Lingula anatina]|uniref:Nephrin-like n=1 Tax=Lingula anatina TaxID=7574 RepID=A0A1S3HQP5_LINAN|nr:nephrin-like [Lingula anatina]|eukprot:XP_013387861.1 nephrin-like [Lingula anatina]
MDRILLLLVVFLLVYLLAADVEVDFTLTPNRVKESMTFSMECKYPEKIHNMMEYVLFQKDELTEKNYIARHAEGSEDDYDVSIKGRATIGHGGRELTIVNASVEDVGLYGCRISYVQEIQNQNQFYQNASQKVLLDVEVDIESLSIENCSHGCSRNFTVEEQLKLTCTAKRSRPAATINWFKHKRNEYIDIGGDSISNVTAVDNYLFTTISHLIFNVTELDNGFRIICQANNTVTGETRNSSEVYLNILFPPPEWSSVPILSRYNQVADTMYDGDIENLTCSVAGGNPLSQLTWSGCPNGSQTALSSSTEAVVQLQFVASASHHGSVCTCTAFQKYASPQERSSNVTLLIAHPPNLDIWASPPLPWLATGDNATINATLNCTATGGYPPATLSWMCKENSTQNGTEGPSLMSVVPIVGVDDDKLVCVCEARNSYTAVKGRVFKAIQLDVEYHPQLKLTALPGNMVNEHDSVRLMCSGYGNPSNITYRLGHGEWSMIGSNQTILNLNRTDTGNYSCTGASKSSRYGQLITVQYLPITVNYLDVQIAILETNLMEGDNVTLECQAEGVPSLYDFKDWTFQSYFMSDTQLLNGTRGRTLHLENINYMESGTYTCVVNNSALVRQGSKLLPILHSPKLHPYRQASQQVAAPVNGNVTLSLYIVANPEPKHDDFVWTKVKPGNASRNVSELASSDGLVSNLTIGNVKESDYGEYCCEVANGIGEKLKAHHCVQQAYMRFLDVPQQSRPKFNGFPLSVVASPKCSW